MPSIVAQEQIEGKQHVSCICNNHTVQKSNCSFIRN